MNKNFLNKIFFIVFALIMFVLNIFIGHSIKEPIFIIMLFFNLMLFLYLVFNIKKRNIIFISNKLDIVIVIFVLCSFIPLIFKTYTSLHEQYNYIIKIISIASIYIFIKNLNINEKNKNIIINILIFSTLPIVIISFDRLYYNNLWGFLCKYDVFKINFEGNRLVANFGYPNTLAIYFSSIIMLILGQLTNTKNNCLKRVYELYSFVLILLIIYTQSRASILLLIIFIIIYLFSLKDKNKSLRILNNIIVSCISIILYFIFKKYKIITLILSLFLVILLNLINDKLLNKKNILRKSLLFYLVTLVVVIIYFIIGLNISKPIEVSDEYVYKIYNKRNLEVYNIDIDIDISTINKKSIIYIYGIADGEIIDLKKDVITEYKGVKEYKIENTKNIEEIIIKFKNYDRENKYIINKLYINSNEKIINYKIIPNVLMNKIKSIKISDKHLTDRANYYKDSLKIIKSNFWFGTGSGSWKYLSQSNKSVDYTAMEVHSFILDIFMSFGIFGLISLLFLITLIIIYSIKLLKEKNKYFNINLSLVLSIFILLIHSFIDFDLSFYIILVYLFILISLLDNNINIDRKNNKLDIIKIVLLILICSINTLNIYSKYKFNLIYEDNISVEEKYKEYKINELLYPTYSKQRFQSLLNYKKYISYKENTDINFDKKNKEKYINSLIKFINDEPYYGRVVTIKILATEVLEEIKSDSYNKRYVEELFQLLNKYSTFNIYSVEEIIDRNEVLVIIYEALEDYLNENNSIYIESKRDEIKEMILTEYEKNKNKIEKYKSELIETNIYLENYETSIKKISK